MKKNKKIIALLVFVIAFSAPLSSLAFTFSVAGYSTTINVNQVLQEVNQTGLSSLTNLVEKRYGFNKDIWRTAQRKENAPKVEISFDNTNPKPGEKVTAHAIPEYFKNDSQNLYYNWYIIHTSDGTPQTATNDIRSGKLEAAKTMARGDYDPNLDGQDYLTDPSKDPDSDGWPNIDSSYDSGKDQAPMGGADGKGGLASDSENIDATLSEYCGSLATSTNCNLYTAKNSFNSYYHFNGAQSNSYCSTCASETLSWGTLSSNNQCCHSVIYPDPSDPSYIAYDPAIAYCPTSYDSAYESCFDYDTLKSTNQSAIDSCLSTHYTECVDDYNEIHSSSTEAGETTNTYTRCFKHNFGTNSNALGYQGYSGDSNTYDNDGSGLDYNVACSHKWEDAPGFTSGTGKLTTEEEGYWKTDPSDPDTDGDGFVDGADVIGLGQQEFTWTYQTGDRVGVVIEGTSMIPTDEKTAYYKIMWGYPDVCDNTKTGLLANDKCDGASDYGYGFMATKAPGEEGDEKLKTSLSYTPVDPIADSSDDNTENIEADGTITDADKITVNASLDNTDLKAENIYYTWQIQKGTLGDESSWEELNIKNNFNTSTASSGLGLSSFSFTPKTDAMTGDGDLVYFKVTLTVTRSSEVKPKSGQASITIPVNKRGISLKLYKVDTKDGKAVLGKEVCSAETSKASCPVVQNQLLAAQVSSSSYTASNSDFSWSIDGKAYPTPSDPSDLFDGWTDETIFLGIIESEGDTPSVTVTATPKTSLQPVTGSRTLSVVSPTISITSNDTNTSWARTYTAEDNSQADSSITMESKNVFDAITDNTVSYGIGFTPDYLYDDTTNTRIDWKINGTSISSSDFSESYLGISEVTTENDGQTLKFASGINEGDTYAIQADVKKYWSADEKNILSTAWGISPDMLESTSSIDVLVMDEEATEAFAPESTSQILAAIGTHLPHYFMYLLRLALTLVVMFVVSAGFYGLTQKFSLFNEEK